MNIQAKRAELKEPAATAAPAPRWYVVQTRQHMETTAFENLERQGFEAYLPMRLAMQKPRLGLMKPKGLVPRPLFPGLLFVRTDLEASRWQRMSSTRGVAKILTGASERPAPLADTVIQSIRAREVGGFVEVGLEADAEAECRFAKGDAVRVSVGWAELDAVFVERVDARRVMILLSLVGRDSPQVVNVYEVKPRTGA